MDVIVESGDGHQSFIRAVSVLSCLGGFVFACKIKPFVDLVPHSTPSFSFSLLRHLRSRACSRHANADASHPN